MKKIILFLFIICILSFSNSAQASKINFELETTNPEKAWTVKLSQEVDLTTLKNDSIIIKSKNTNEQVPISVSINEDLKSFTIHPPLNGYKFGDYVVDFQKIKSKKGIQLKPTTFQFSILPPKTIVTISSISDSVKLPDNITISGENSPSSYKVTWDLSTMKNIYATNPNSARSITNSLSPNAVEITGTIEELNVKTKIEYIFDELYFSSFKDSLVSPFIELDQNPENYQEVKFVQLIWNSVTKNISFKELVEPDRLLTGHFNDTAKSILSTSIADRILTSTIFDITIPEEREISDCMSSLFSARLLTDFQDVKIQAEQCANNIISYMSESIGIDLSQISDQQFTEFETQPPTSFKEMEQILTKETFDLTGTWYLVKQGGSGSLLILKQKKGEVTGQLYSLEQDGYQNTAEIKGTVSSNFADLQSLWSKDYFNMIVKRFGSNYKWPGANVINNPYTITYTSGRTPSEYSGKFTQLLVYRNSIKLGKSTNVNYYKVKDFKDADTGWGFNEFDYLEQLKNQNLYR